MLRDETGRLVLRAHEPWGREAELGLPGRTGWLVAGVQALQ